MEIQCPVCKATQMTKGRIEFPCRFCGTVLTDPRTVSDPATDELVELAAVLHLARRKGVYRQMQEVISLPIYKKGDCYEDSKH